MQLPTLRRHATGHWFARHKGVNTYFGADRQAASAAYEAWIAQVVVPARQERQQATAARHGHSGPPGTAKGKRPPTVAELVRAYLLDCTDRNLHPETLRGYKRDLAAITHTCGALPAFKFDAEILRAIRRDLKPHKSPRTINHAVNTAKQCFSWAADEGLIPARPDLRAIKGMSIDPAPKHPLLQPRIVSLIAKVRQHWLDQDRPDIAGDAVAWMSLQYLTAMRTTEVPRLVHRQGEWEIDPANPAARNVYRLAQSKTGRSTGLFRCIVMSPEALTHFHRASPRWKTASGYQRAVWSALGGGLQLPHVLRHSAATHLDAAGAAEADIRRALGHVTPGALRSYLRIAHERLLPVMAQLSLQSSAAGEASGGSSLVSGADDFWGS